MFVLQIIIYNIERESAKAVDKNDEEEEEERNERKRKVKGKEKAEKVFHLTISFFHLFNL